jgi:hypothetical protein
VINRKTIDLYLSSIQTTKLLAITSAETLYELGTANHAFEVTNLGTQNVYYGDSGVLVNSGGLISPDGSKFWDRLEDTFTLYFVVASGGVSSNIVVHEYA